MICCCFEAPIFRAVVANRCKKIWKTTPTNSTKGHATHERKTVMETGGVEKCGNGKEGGEGVGGKARAGGAEGARAMALHPASHPLVLVADTAYCRWSSGIDCSPCIL